MRRVWLGMALGWGGLLLYAGVAFGFVLLRAQDKAQARWTEALAEEREQEEALRALDTRFAFRTPPQGEALALDAQRLQAYLAVREEALAAFERFEKGAREVGDDDGAQAPPGKDALALAGRRAELGARLRAALVRSLRKHRMSPSEFQALTGTLYAAEVGTRGASPVEKRRKRMEEAVAQLEKVLEDEDLPALARQALEAQRQRLEAQQDELEARLERQREQRDGAGVGAVATEAHAAARADAALSKDVRERLARIANPAFDLFLLGEGAPPPPPLPGRPLPPVPPKG